LENSARELLLKTRFVSFVSEKLRPKLTASASSNMAPSMKSALMRKIVRDKADEFCHAEVFGERGGGYNVGGEGQGGAGYHAGMGGGERK
jgi:hypothetical protein